MVVEMETPIRKLMNRIEKMFSVFMIPAIISFVYKLDTGIPKENAVLIKNGVQDKREKEELSERERAFLLGNLIAEAEAESIESNTVIGLVAAWIIARAHGGV